MILACHLVLSPNLHPPAPDPPSDPEREERLTLCVQPVEEDDSPDGEDGSKRERKVRRHVKRLKAGEDGVGHGCLEIELDGGRRGDGLEEVDDEREEVGGEDKAEAEGRAAAEGGRRKAWGELARSRFRWGRRATRCRWPATYIAIREERRGGGDVQEEDEEEDELRSRGHRRDRKSVV